MEIVNITRAKAEFEKLLERVDAGGEIIIARGRKPIARLVGGWPEGGVKIQRYEHKSVLADGN
jgi:prevent-host-death family protein